MNFTKDDLKNLSELARISIKEGEEEKMFKDISAILGYVSEINEAVTDLEKDKEIHYNITKEDNITCEAGSKTEAILNNAPDTEDGYVKVAQVLK